MKRKSKKIVSIAITAIMLLSILTAMMPVIAATATDKGIEEPKPFLNIDKYVVDSDSSAEEERGKEIQKAHEMLLERIKQMPKTPGNLYVYVYEYYNYDLGPDKLIKSYIPSLYLHINLYDVDIDSVTVDFQLPVGITPEYNYGYIPEDIYYNEATGKLSVTYDTSEMTDGYLYTGFNLPGLDVNPFTTAPPIPYVMPSYCAINESKGVTVALSPATLKETYDWGNVYFQVMDVKNISITDTTPIANYTYVYNDTTPYNGDYYSYAYAAWYLYGFNSLPAHAMSVYLQNDIDEVDTWYSCYMGKYTGTNVEIIDVTTKPDVSVYSDMSTDIYSYVYSNLDPANSTTPHGFLEGIAYTETGGVLSGAEVRISGMDFYLHEITDKNGKYHAMLPPGTYSVSADYGYIAYDDEYKSEYFSVSVSEDATTTQDLMLYKVPTVKMKISPIDDLIGDGAICYDVTIKNTGDKTESISLYGYDWVWDSTGYYLYDILEWTFSENYFELDPGEKKVVRADAEFVGTEPLDWGKYAFMIYCYPESDGIRGYYYLTDFFEVHGVFDIEVAADKDTYTIGEPIKLGMKLESHGGPYNIDLGIDVEYSDERWNYGALTGQNYPANYIWTGKILIAIPSSKLMPPGDYEFIVWIKDSATGQLLGEGSDTVSIEHGKLSEKISIEKFE